jgi:hypothetical protein
MEAFDFSGINQIFPTKKDSKTATERVIYSLSHSSIGTEKNSRSKTFDTFSLTKNISELLSPACGMTDEEKSRYLQQIMAKLKSGKRLTAEEMRFLQAEDPVLYQQAARIQSMRDSLSARLSHCSSKEEAAEIYSQAMSSVSDEDPAKEFVVAAYDDAYKEFQKSDAYEALPDTEKEAREKKASA